jgi:hypothetical protein
MIKQFQKLSLLKLAFEYQNVLYSNIGNFCHRFKFWEHISSLCNKQTLFVAFITKHPVQQRRPGQHLLLQVDPPHQLVHVAAKKISAKQTLLKRNNISIKEI